MGTKQHEVNLMLEGRGCLGKAASDEPIFILRGQDKLAPDLIEQWANMAYEMGCPAAKVQEAHDLADQMRNWHLRKYPD